MKNVNYVPPADDVDGFHAENAPLETLSYLTYL